MPDTQNTNIPPAQPLSPRSSISVEAADQSQLAKILSATDAGAALGQFQNKTYLEMERKHAHLPAFKKSVQELQTLIQHGAIPRREQKKLMHLTRDLMRDIDRVNTAKSTSSQIPAKMFFSFASISLCLLPLMTAVKNQDNQYFGLLVATYTNTMSRLAGLVLGSTADARSFMGHLRERHVPALIPTLPYALSAYNEHVKEFQQTNPMAFNGAALAFTASAFCVTSAPHLFMKPLNAVYQTCRDYFADSSGKAPSPKEVSADLALEINGLMETFKNEHAALQERRKKFEDKGNRLSDALSTQVSDVDSAAMALDDSLRNLLRLPPEKHANNDRTLKLAFAVTAAILSVCAAATYYNEPVGLIDLGTDVGLTSFELLKTAFDPAETAQRAAEKFASYAGLTPFLLIFGLVNQIPATHFTGTMTGLIVGTIVLTVAHMALTRPGGEWFANTLVKMMDWMKNASGSSAEDNDEIEMEDLEFDVDKIEEFLQENDNAVAAKTQEVTEENDNTIPTETPQVTQSGIDQDLDEIVVAKS